MPPESFNASQYVTADSDPEEYESLEQSKSKPSFSILKRTQNGLIHESKDRQFDMRKSVSTESYEEEKYISKSTGYHSSNQPIPALRRRTGNIANLPEKFKDTEIKSKKESEISSEIFLTPAASSPRRHRHRPSRRYHSDDDSPNVSSLEQISSSEEDFISSTNTTTTDSDLYITVNETPQKPVLPRIHSDLSADLQRKMEKLQTLKIPIAQKIEQLRNCLNKLENNQLSASLEHILHESLLNERKPLSVPTVRESYPPTHSRLLNSRHRESRTQPAHSVHKKSSPNNVDIKLSMDIPSGKIYVNERNIKKSKHRGHQTYEIHLDSSESTEKSSNRSKDDSYIDIKLKPKKKSHKKIYVVNPPHGSEFPTKYEKFEYLNSEYNDKSRLTCNEPTYKGPYRHVTENDHNRHNPRFYNHAAGHTEAHQNGWDRGQYIDERCDRIVANTTSSAYQKVLRSNAEKSSCNKEKQRQEPSRMRENGHPSGHLYPKLTTLTDNDDEPCENHSTVRCVQMPSRLQRQQQNVHLRTVSGRDHPDVAIEENIVKQVFQPPFSKAQAAPSKRTQEVRKPDSQVFTRAEVHREEEPSRNKISAGNKNFRFGGRVVQKPCHKDIAAKTTVPMVMNTPLNPKIAHCKLYETESAVQNTDPKRTESDVSCATTDTYVTCRTMGSENSEKFFSCDDGTNESALDSKFGSALHSFSSYLRKQLEQSTSQESSSFQDFRFTTEELSKAMVELNLKEGNDSSIDAETYMSMLSQIEDQIITEPQQNGQESDSLYTSRFENVNTPENSCYISTSEQHQPVNSQQVIQRQSVSPELKCYEPKEGKYNSALLPRESDEDSLYLVCIPNNSSAAQFQSFDEPDSKHLVPKPPKLPSKSQLMKYSASRDHGSNATENISGSHSTQFSQVMSELQSKFHQKAAKPNISAYRWQPPDYVLKPKLSCSANKAVGSTVVSSSALHENLKRNVSLELKNHPLVKKFHRLEDGEPSSSCVENSSHYYSQESSDNANCSNIISEPIVSKTNAVPSKTAGNTSRSHFVSFEEKKNLHCKPNRKQDRLVDLHSYYTSVQEEDGLDYSRYVSVQEEEVQEQQQEHVDSRYVSVQSEAKPADSQYLSFQEDEIPNSRYLSVQEENQPFASQSHYLSVREELEASSSSKPQSMSTQNQNKSVNSQSHFLSAQEDGLGISKINHVRQRGKRIPQNSHSGCKKQPAPQNEPVTLQSRFTSPIDNYESVQDGMTSVEGQYFSTVQNSSSSLNPEQSAILDKSAVNSQWQYVSASSGFHNRSVTWQNPISTYDEPDAVVVVSTDDSLSWSPGKDGHPPQIPPFTSTSASEDVTSGSTSSDGLKKCLATKEFLSPEKRTTMWVNGLYKIEEYFDQNISSINPVTSQSSSSDNVNNMRKIAANANRPQPSAPPKSEVFSEFTTAHSNFNTATDISTVAVAGTTGNKSDPLNPSSRSPQRHALYPSLPDTLLSPASSHTPQGKEPMIQNRLASDASVHVSFDQKQNDNDGSSAKFVDNVNDNDQVGFVGNKTAMCAVNVLPSVSSKDVEQKLPNIKQELVNFKSNKTISTQTPILRIPPSPPTKKANSHSPKPPNHLKNSSNITITNYTNDSKSPKRFEKLRKTIVNLKKLLPSGKSQRKTGKSTFISVDRSPKFFSSNPGRSAAKTGTSGTQTDKPIYYEPTLPAVQIIKSDELSLSVNFSEHLSDYSEKYPGSIIDHLKRPKLSDTLDICSSSGATSGSIERFLTLYQEENNQAPVGFDEVDFMPTLSQANEIIATVHYGETYRSCIKLPDKRDKDIKFIHIDPERHINFIERRISVEPESSHSDDSLDAKKYSSKSPEETSSESSDELFWKSFSKAKKDKTLTDAKLLQLQSVLKSNSSFTDDSLKKIFVDFDLPLPGPITSTTRGMYLNRLKAFANGSLSPKVLPSPGKVSPGTTFNHLTCPFCLLLCLFAHYEDETVFICSFVKFLSFIKDFIRQNNI